MIFSWSVSASPGRWAAAAIDAVGDDFTFPPPSLLAKLMSTDTFLDRYDPEIEPRSLPSFLSMLTISVVIFGGGSLVPVGSTFSFYLSGSAALFSPS